MADRGHHQDELRYVKLADIRIDAGHNPRSTADPERLAELTESVRSRGVLQPLLLAHAEDGALALELRLGAGSRGAPGGRRRPRSGGQPAV